MPKYDYEVLPIAMPQIDWKTICHEVKGKFGYTPTRGLDEAGIKLECPAALPLAFSSQSPLGVMRDPCLHAGLLHHASLSFMILTDDGNLIGGLSDAWTAGTSLVRSSDDDYCIIASADLFDWYLSIVCGTNSTNFGVRLVSCTLYSFCCKAGLKDLWDSHKRVNNSDGTFGLKTKG